MQKFAYAIFVAAALFLGGRMFLEISKETHGSEGPPSFVTTEPYKSLTGLPVESKSHSSESALLQRIDQILNPDHADNIEAGPEPSKSTVDEGRDSSQTAAVPADTSRSDKAKRQSAPPIRQQTPLHSSLLTPGNFVYLGGFRPEFGEGMDSRFGLGGWAIAYRPDGDPNGATDGYPGSLFMVGHRHHELVAEISIPAPVVSPPKKLNDLPVAGILQPFADITAGLRTRMTDGSSEPFEIGGMHVVGDRLHWTLYKYYNVNRVDYLSHGLSSVNLSSRAMHGMWHLGPQQSSDPAWHSYKHAGYIADIPKDIADRYLGGRNLMSGLQISTGRQTSSQGPALFAYKIDDENLPAGSSLDATPLLWYPMSAPMEQHHPADSWQGAAWLTLGDKQAIIVVGRKALGPVYYGMPRPGECYDYKGYHASAYEAQMLFYSPEQILNGARQRVPDTPTAYRWDADTPGGGLDRFMFQTCRKEIGGIAFDRAHNLLYISEVNAGLSDANEWEEIPVVHVLKLVP